MERRRSRSREQPRAAAMPVGWDAVPAPVPLDQLQMQMLMAQQMQMAPPPIPQMPQLAMNQLPQLLGYGLPASMLAAPPQQISLGAAGVTNTAAAGSTHSVPPTLGDDKPGCPYKLGYVSHIILEKGYSVLTTKDQTAILVSKNLIEPSKMVLNEPCAVRVQVNQDNLLFGIAPLYRLKGEVKQGYPIEFGDFHGLVKQAQKNGDRFVDCPEVKDKHGGRDAYIHSSVANQCELNEGDGICFNLHINKTGMPQVPMPVWKRCKQGAGQISGELDQEIYFGWVMETHEEHSMIYSQTFGNLTAVKAVCDPQFLNKGELVAFGVRERPNNMLPDRVEAPLLKFCGQDSKSSWACFGEFIGKINDDAESLMALAAGQGTFVNCLATSEQFGRDVYVHTAILSETGLVPGDIICFKVHINKKGWPQLTAPVWKIMSPERASSKWVKCDRIKAGAAQKTPGQLATAPMLPMSDFLNGGSGIPGVGGGGGGKAQSKGPQKGMSLAVDVASGKGNINAQQLMQFMMAQVKNKQGMPRQEDEP